MKKSIMKGVMLVLMITCLVGCNSENETSKKEDKPRKEEVVKEAYDVTNEEKQEQTADGPKTDAVHTESEEQSVEKADVPEEPAMKPQTESKQTAQTSQKVTTEPNDETPKTTEPPVQNTPTQNVPTVPNATANDSRAVADKVLEYINSYRSTPATKLPGLTTYAEYRSRQLVRKFAHDTFDERAAATALQYGRYIDPTLYGIEGEPYYEPGAREAIAKAGYAGSIDYVAKSIAGRVKNSASHWAYVGASQYAYIAVGITYESGMWYCDIAVARENTDNK